jgi:hypothetical protein
VFASIGPVQVPRALWAGLFAKTQAREYIGPVMNWRRLLFRLWLIASGIWMCDWTLRIWRSCTTDLAEVWCRTDYSEWYYPFSKFTTLTCAVIAVWGNGAATGDICVGRRGLLG